MNLDQKSPKEIAAALDKHIIGQDDAKKSVAIALRNRWRRAQTPQEIRSEITPKNILMIGPTGVGKTEIARRIALLDDAPFIKIEATKFTEVGYVGRDVESIIRDLVELAIKRLRRKAFDDVYEDAVDAAEERILDVLLPGGANKNTFFGDQDEQRESGNSTRQIWRKKLREGVLDDKEIDIDITQPAASMEVLGPPGLEEISNQIQAMMQSVGNRQKRSRHVKISEAKRLLIEEESERFISEEDIKAEAVTLVENKGIVFLDEVDKIAASANGQGADVSRQGVQRDLLPLIEGTTVTTRYGSIRTDYILFIASGAFHVAKPSDLIPELQGRFPIRVELNPLSVNDFKRILTEPKASLTEQYQALLQTEEIYLNFSEDAITRIAEISYQVNEGTENIGARRLHTLLEKLLEEVSFAIEDYQGQTVNIDQAYVDKRLSEIAGDYDLSRYIL